MGEVVVVLSLALAIAGCVKSPADQCLDSFRSSLKDPGSGKAIGFSDGALTYTATNSYGARTQGKAICREFQGKWSRNHRQEELKASERAVDLMNEFKKCQKGGGSVQTCAGDSIGLKLMGSGSVAFNVDEYIKESARALGFE